MRKHDVERNLSVLLLRRNHRCLPSGRGGLLYTIAIDQPARDQTEQQLYCHTLCLLERLHTSVKLYALDIDGSED